MVASIDIDGTQVPIELDFGNGEWHADAPELDEAAYPITFTADGTAYELYSDGTFSESHGKR